MQKRQFLKNPYGAPKTSITPYFKKSKSPNSHEQILQGTRAAERGSIMAQKGIARLGMVEYMPQDARARENSLIRNSVRRGYIQRYQRRKYQF